jgi:hypothetical protein
MKPALEPDPKLARKLPSLPIFLFVTEGQLVAPLYPHPENFLVAFLSQCGHAP